MSRNTKRMLRCTTLLAVAIGCATYALGQSFQAASARREITPDLETHTPVYLAGFGENRVATKVHDPLYARCLALKAQAAPVVLCSVDVIGLFFDDVQKIRELSREKTGIPELSVIVAATHNHQGPDTMGLWGPAVGKTGIHEGYMQFLQHAVAETASQAVKALVPAQAVLGSASDQTLTNTYEDSRPPVVHDDLITALHVTDREGDTLGILVNWNSHPESLGSKNTEITADYLASFYRKMDSETSSVVFWNGALGGMQSPLGGRITDPTTNEDLRDPSFRFAEVLGDRLAQVTRDALEKGQQIDVDAIHYRESLILIPVANKQFLAALQASIFGQRKQLRGMRSIESPVGLLRLQSGEEYILEAAMIPGEAYPELSVGGIEVYPGADFPSARRENPYREIMRARNQMVVGLANDEIGYIIPKLEWDTEEPYLQNAREPWYGEVNSPGPETAPRIAEALERLVAGEP